ncbi:MAG: hypothetical protein JSW54_12460, partial [Fidelibacterota bacterium]
MMKRRLKVAAILMIMCLVPLAHVLADQRSYVWTYEYKTVARGEAELETYFTLSAPEIDAMEGLTNVEHRLELEVGMTDRFDFAIYQIFSQDFGSSLVYDGFQLRARYRFGERGKYFVDPLLYLEYKSNADFSEREVEGKLILAKDFGRWNLAFNPILELEHEDEWEVET